MSLGSSLERVLCEWRGCALRCWENVNSPLVSFQRAANQFCSDLPSSQGTGESHWDVMTTALRQAGSLPRIPWSGLGDLQSLPPTFHGAQKRSAPHFGTQARLPGLSSHCSFWALGSLIHPPPHAHPTFPTQAGRGIKRPCSRRPSGLSAVLSRDPCSWEKMPATHTHFLGL